MPISDNGRDGPGEDVGMGIAWGSARSRPKMTVRMDSLGTPFHARMKSPM